MLTGCVYTAGSKKVGSLAPGTVVHVLEKSVNAQGQARLKTAAGWVSLVARDGTVLLEDTKIEPTLSRRGVVPDDERERSVREDLAADRTAWLLDRPDGDLSGWVAESEWVRSLGSNSYGPFVASRCWPEVFKEQQRQMELLEESDEEQPAERLDFADLRALGRQWAVTPVIYDTEDIVREPLTAPAPMPGGDRIDDSSVGVAPATWSDVRDAVASAAKAMEAFGEAASTSAAVSTVNSPHSGAVPSPVSVGALSLPWVSTRAQGHHKDEGDDDIGDEEWTCIDSAWCGARSETQRVDTEWELVDTE